MSKETEENDVVKSSRERLVEWRAAHPRATLTEIELEVERELKLVREQLVATMTEGNESAEAEGQACPQCQTAMVRNGKRKRMVQGRDGTQVELEPEQMRCPSYGMTVFPPG